MADIAALPDPGLGNTSWLVDLGDGSALVIDPQRDPRPVLAAAASRDVTVRAVAETHLHADFVSGARELAAVGAEVLAPADAELAFDHRPLRGGDEVALGGLALRVLATPGHTPEHVAYLLVEGERPVALFSGGTLIAGGVARPDLVAPQLTEPLARDAWRSITRQLLVLPDDLPVHPTHGGGSFCSSGGAGGAAATTIGAERTTNPLLQAGSEDDFVARLLGALGSYPPYFLRLRPVNQAGPTVYGPQPPTLPTLGIGELDRLRVAGAELIDVRSVAAFAAGHVPGSLSIELRDSFATWLGWIVSDPATPLVFVVDGRSDLADLVWRCRTVGYEQLVGTVTVAAWAEDGRALATVVLAERPPPGHRVLDVRQRAERETTHAPGSLHVELGALPARAAELPDGPLVVHCEHGQRAMTAASVLARGGRDQLAVATSGPGRWASPAA